MSVRAYKVTKMEVSVNETLNLWHDEGVIKYMGNYIYPRLNNNTISLVWLNHSEAKEALKQAQTERADKDTLSILKKIVKETNNKSEGAYYYCF